MDTAKTVFILGAGASRDAGAPLMWDFLDVADNLWKTGKVDSDSGHYERILRRIGQLQPIYSKAKLDFVNIESVFATFEMAKILQRLPGVQDEDVNDEVKECLKSLKRLISRTLEASIIFKISDGHVYPTQTYDNFSYLLQVLQQNTTPSHSISIITFNYDIALDYALYHRSIPLTYILGESSTRSAIPVLKLHGSLNWGKCTACEEISPFRIDNYISRITPHPISNAITLNIASSLGQLQHTCGQNFENEPILVPPTWNKN